MARPQVADAGHGLQIWWVASNILNDQSRTANKVWSSSLGVGLQLLTIKNKFVTKCHNGPLHFYVCFIYLLGCFYLLNVCTYDGNNQEITSTANNVLQYYSATSHCKKNC
jgi:hypothetical protein